MALHELSRADARRVAIRAQLLDARRPDGLLDVVRHLTLLQHDQTAAVAPSADLIAWSRLGSDYSPRELAGALTDRTLIELHGMVRPAEDLALYTADMAEWPGPGPLRGWQEAHLRWLEANDACRLDVLHRLGSDGPLAARDLPHTCAVPWRSTGWSNNRNVGKLLDILVLRGEVAMSGWRGRVRLWDLAERVYPDEPSIPVGEARRRRDTSRLRSLGITRPWPECSNDSSEVGEAGEPAVVEGVKGRWRVDPAQLGQPFSGRAALLSPLDRLVFDRRRLAELFEFDYQLEMYKPAAQRRWGYFALPILYGDRLVGKLDATADRAAGVLRVDEVHQDVTFTRSMTAAIDQEIKDLASWLGLDLMLADSGR